MNKRGQQLSTTAIILIVLGILILVFLIIGFSIGWSKILPWIKPSNNVKEVADACNLACNTGAKYSYCSEKREVRVTEPIAGQKTTKFKATCYELANKKEYVDAKLGIVNCTNLLPC